MSEEVFEIPKELPSAQPSHDGNVSDQRSSVPRSKRKYKISDEKREILKANLAKGRETMRLRREQRKKELITLKAENEALKKEKDSISSVSSENVNVNTTSKFKERNEKVSSVSSVSSENVNANVINEVRDETDVHSKFSERNQIIPKASAVKSMNQPHVGLTPYVKPQVIYSFKKRK